MPSWWYRVRADVPSDRRPGGEGCVDRHHQPAILRMATGQPEAPSVQDADRPPVDGGAGLERALASLWPEIPTQRCTVHYADVRIMPTSGAEPAWRAAIAA